MMVKVCGITRREDALVAAEAGASAIGFIFYPKSPRYVTPERAAALGEGLDLWKVGVFVDESPVTVEAVMRAAHLDVAQIYGGERARGARGFGERSGWRIRWSLAGRAPKRCLLDGAKNGVSFDWTLARGAAAKVIVAGGLDASNVAEAIRIAEPWGVDASSKLETAPGIKDHDKVRAFVKAAREATW